MVGEEGGGPSEAPSLGARVRVLDVSAQVDLAAPRLRGHLHARSEVGGDGGRWRAQLDLRLISPPQPRLRGHLPVVDTDEDART